MKWIKDMKGNNLNIRTDIIIGKDMTYTYLSYTSQTDVTNLENKFTRFI